MVAVAARKRHTTYLRLPKISLKLRAMRPILRRLAFRLIGNKRFTIVDRKNLARMAIMAASRLKIGGRSTLGSVETLEEHRWQLKNGTTRSRSVSK
ncbi:hypothetical protein ACE04B_41130, partial [Rhizobium phaseoli]